MLSCERRLCQSQLCDLSNYSADFARRRIRSGAILERRGSSDGRFAASSYTSQNRYGSAAGLISRKIHSPAMAAPCPRVVDANARAERPRRRSHPRPGRPAHSERMASRGSTPAARRAASVTVPSAHPSAVAAGRRKVKSTAGRADSRVRVRSSTGTAAAPPASSSPARTRTPARSASARCTRGR